MNVRISSKPVLFALLLFSFSLLAIGLGRGASPSPLEWRSAGDLPAEVGDGVADGVAFVLSDTLYYGAGLAGNPPQPLRVIYAAALSEGVPSPWARGPDLPGEDRVGAAAAVFNNHVYLVGSGILNRKRVDSFNGHTWRTETPLPEPLRFPAAAVVRGRLYVAGGLPGPTNKVWSAPIGEDGVLGAWREEEGDLPIPLVTQLAVWDSNDCLCLYVIGGKDDLEFPHSEVYRARWGGSEGRIMGWDLDVAASLHQPLARHGVAVRDGVLYVAGGETVGGSLSSRIYSATISTDCALSEWEEAQLPPEGQARRRMALAAYSHGLYLIGGEVSGGFAKDTWYELSSSLVLTTTPSLTATPSQTLAPTATATPSSTATQSKSPTPTPKGKLHLPLVLRPPRQPTPTRTPDLIPTPTATPWCDPYEPNDDRRVNPWGPLVSGQAIQAKLCRGDEEDNYYFDATTTNLIRIRLQLPGALVGHTVVALYSVTDLSQAVCSQAPVSVADYTLLCPPSRVGRYIIRLYTDGVWDDENTYTLTATFP